MKYAIQHRAAKNVAQDFFLGCNLVRIVRSFEGTVTYGVQT